MCFDKNGPTSFLTDSVVSAGIAAAKSAGSSVSIASGWGKMEALLRFFRGGSQDLAVAGAAEGLEEK